MRKVFENLEHLMNKHEIFLMNQINEKKKQNDH